MAPMPVTTTLIFCSAMPSSAKEFRCRKVRPESDYCLPLFRASVG